MKLPNGYGSVIRLSRHRRKPYAVRVTLSRTDDGKQKKYLGTFQTRQEALNALANYNQSPFDVDLRKRHIQTVIDACPLSVQAKSHMKSVYSQIFKYAIDQEIVATNYATPVELPVK